MHRLIDANMPYIIFGCFGMAMSARAVARMRINSGPYGNALPHGQGRWRVIRTESATTTNRTFPKNYSPPYRPGTQTQIIELTRASRPGEFVRVYGNGSAQQGGWIMRASDIRGLTPQQIQNKFSLPSTPTHVTDVILPAGTQIRVGVANEAFGSQGGGIQFDLEGQRAGEFINGRPLPSQ